MSKQQLIEKPKVAADQQRTAFAEEALKQATATTSKKRAFAFFVALFVFACANIYLAMHSQWYHPSIEQAILDPGAEENGHSKVWSWWLARRYLQQKAAPDIVLFGSSQMGSAHCAADAQHTIHVVDALTHRHAVTMEDDLSALMGRRFSIFSLASPGAMCSDALMGSRALFTPKLTPKLVIIGVAPRDFIDNTMPYPAATEPYRFYSQYASPGTLLRHAYIEPMSWLQYAVDSVPFKQLGTYMQATFAQSDNALTAGRSSEDLAKRAAGVTKDGATPMAAVLGGAAVPGMWRVPANIPPIWADNTKEYKNRFRNPRMPVYDCETRFFAQFLTDMQARGVKVLVIGMPSLPMNRALLPDTFWSSFRGMLQSQTKAHDAQFLELFGDPQFQKSDYLDTVHLNASGGAKLFATMARYVSSDPELAKLLK